MGHRKDDRHYMASVKLGPKGQIVIPKEARAMFGLEPGDTLVLLADKKRGIALQTTEKLSPLRAASLTGWRAKRRTRHESAGGYRDCARRTRPSGSRMCPSPCRRAR